MGKKKRKVSNINEDIIEINSKKCINCTTCAVRCSKNMEKAILKCGQGTKRGIRTKEENFESSGCINCGDCTVNCPTGAIHEKLQYKKVKDAMESDKYAIVIFDPLVKNVIGEEFGVNLGKDLSKELYTSARLLGFQRVYDSNIGIEINLIETAKEFYLKFEREGKSPIFTSICPSFYKWIKLYKPNILPYISSSKIPEENLAKFLREYIHEEIGIPKKNVHITLVTNCFACIGSNKGDIDATMTIREYASVIKSLGMDIVALPQEECDTIINDTEINRKYFNSEEEIKYLINILEKYIGEKIDIESREVLDGLIMYKVNIKNNVVSIAILEGVANIREFIEEKKWKEYDILNIKVCKDGCLNGGGMPKVKTKSTVNEEKCIGCGSCMDVCQVKAISWSTGAVVKIDKEKCIGCGACSYICRSNAIKINYYYKSFKRFIDNSLSGLRNDNIRKENNKNIILLEDIKFLSLYEKFFANNK